MADQNRKTLHSFYCRDYLWELFEVMTRDLGCSMDYLINEAMRHYARSRNYSLAQASRQADPQVVSPYQQQQQPQHPPASYGGGHRGGHREHDSGRRPPPPLPEMGRGRPEPMGGGRPTLFMLFNGQRHRIDKDKFVIGRGSQVTDLTIRDGNISRKHCAVIFRGGSWFIKDLDSTNGIEFNGKRIEHKRVEEGDTFYLCDYELRFTYR